jgi:hypothetical protein
MPFLIQDEANVDGRLSPSCASQQLVQMAKPNDNSALRALTESAMLAAPALTTPTESAFAFDTPNVVPASTSPAHPLPPLALAPTAPLLASTTPTASDRESSNTEGEQQVYFDQYGWWQLVTLAAAEAAADGGRDERKVKEARPPPASGIALVQPV